MKHINQWLCKSLEWSVIACVAGSILVVLWGVLSRFVVAVPSRWTEELAVILLNWTALLGAAVAFRNRQHLGVDYIFQKLDAEARHWNAIIIQGLIVLFALVVMLWGGGQLAWNTLGTGQVTAALGVRIGWTYLAVPLSGLSIALFSIEEICRLTAKETFFEHDRRRA